MSAKSAIGVASILSTPILTTTNTPPAPTRAIFSQFALNGRVALVTGGRRGIGLEMALALAEAGAKAVYCLDLPEEAGEEWGAVKAHVEALPPVQYDENLQGGKGGQGGGKSRLEYASVDVTNQKAMWECVERIVEKEGRIDVCVACAGILAGAECLEYPGEDFKKIIDVNVHGVLFTAQAAGRQMERLGIPGSIILIASMSGSIANQGQHWTAYNTSKAAVIQMARSMACELGVKGIRVNSISPGYIYSKMTEAYLKPQPELMAKWASQNPLGRIGGVDELRGVVTWLAGDASTFCTGSDIIVDGGHRAW